MINKIKRIGVIGSGKMGEDIFNFFIDSSYPSVWIVKKDEEIFFEKFKKKILRKVKNGLLSEESCREIMDNSQISSDMKNLTGCNLVIESINEDLKKKRALFFELEKIVDIDAVFATNSSSFVPSKIISKRLSGRVLGLHFFYPVKIRDVIEVIIPEGTKIEAVSLVEDLLKKLKRFYIKQDEINAFVLNKLFFEVQAFSYNYFVEHKIFDARLLDKAVKKELMPAGAFEMWDNIGIDTLLASAYNYLEEKEDKTFYLPFVNTLEELFKAGKLGKKSSAGFYDYSGKEAAEPVKENKAIEEDFCRSLTFFMINIFLKQVEKKIFTPEELDHSLQEYFGLTRSIKEMISLSDKKEIFLFLSEKYKNFKIDIFKPASFLKY